MKKIVVRLVVMVACVVLLGIVAVGLVHHPCATASDCCATKQCDPGWHCCPTANGGCGCFLDAQGPCP
jgi:hypothetical protein